MTAKPEETNTPVVEEAEAIAEQAAEEKGTNLKDRVVSVLKDPALYKRVGLFVAGVATTAAIVIITKKGGLEYEAPAVEDEENREIADADES